MQEFGILFISAVLVNNFVLSRFLGLCPFMGASGKPEMATGMSFATTFVLTLVSALAWFFDNYLLVPYELTYLRVMVYIFASAVVVQLAETIIRKTSPALYRLLGIFLPLITTNCAVLAVPLINITQNNGFLLSTFYGFSAAFGFSLVQVLFSSLRDRLKAANVPAPFKGSPISLITAGLMSLAFMGFTGLTEA